METLYVSAAVVCNVPPCGVYVATSEGENGLVWGDVTVPTASVI
jgi:hypothetical protein